MKIQFHGGQTFTIAGKGTKVALNPDASITDSDFDFATFSSEDLLDKVSGSFDAKKKLSLPGEFEISEILITSFYASELQKNVVSKITMENISFVDFGDLQKTPDTKFFEKLGENFDLVFLNLSENFKAEDAKKLIEMLDPRMAIIGGDSQFFPKMTELTGAKTVESNPMNIKRSDLSDDKTEVVILPL